MPRNAFENLNTRTDEDEPVVKDGRPALLASVGAVVVWSACAIWSGGVVSLLWLASRRATTIDLGGYSAFAAVHIIFGYVVARALTGVFRALDR